MAFPAVLDTCVLVPMYLCGTLLRLAEAETYRPLWSAEILEELRRTLVDAIGLDEAAVNRRLTQLRRSFPDAEVAGYEDLIPAMTTQEKDRHVAAAAVRTNAEVIVTFNVRDLPARTGQQLSSTSHGH